MKKILLLILSSLFLHATSLHLTKEEKDFLKKHPIVKVSNLRNFPPYNFYRDGKAQGYSIDYIKLLSKKVGFKLDIVTGFNWYEFLEKFKNKEIDVLLNISKSKKREKFISFTVPISKGDLGIVSKKTTYFNKIEDLNFHTIGLVKNSWYQDAIQKYYPDINIKSYTNNLESVKAVSNGKVDAIVGHIPAINYLWNEAGIDNIHINAKIDIPALLEHHNHIGVRKDWEIFRDILDKAIHTITKDEAQRLKNKWQIDTDISKRIIFSKDEQEYLAQKGDLKICVTPQAMPMEAIEKGKLTGMSADYVKYFEKLSGINITLYPTKNWAQSLQALKDKRCDLTINAKDTKERREFLNFTTPYNGYFYVIATTNDKLFIDDFSNVLDKKFAVIKGYSVIKGLKKIYPNLHIKEVESVKEGLFAVLHGEVFGYLDAASVIAYHIQKNHLPGLKISGQLSSTASALSIATIKDEPILNDIFQKIVNNIEPKVKQDIYQKWVNVKFEKGVDYTLVKQILLVGLIIILAFTYWNRKLTKTVKELRKTKEKLLESEKRLELMAVTDQLTGLYNRFRIEEVLENEINRFERFKVPFGVILLDIDHFKNINDTYGHNMGDEILKQFSTTLKENCRKTDTIGRWGGEEFIIISPQIDKDGIIKLAEKLRNKIYSYDLESQKQISASFGVTLYQEEESIENLISRADTALYKAKQNGRNQSIYM